MGRVKEVFTGSWEGLSLQQSRYLGKIHLFLSGIANKVLSFLGPSNQHQHRARQVQHLGGGRVRGRGLPPRSIPGRVGHHRGPAGRSGDRRLLDRRFIPSGGRRNHSPQVGHQRDLKRRKLFGAENQVLQILREEELVLSVFTIRVYYILKYYYVLKRKYYRFNYRELY